MRSRTLWNRFLSRPHRADQSNLHSAQARRRRRLRMEALEERNLFAIAPAGAEFQVNSWTTGTQDLARDYGNSIAIDQAGNFVVTWSSSDQSGGSGSDVYAQRYLPDGTPAGSEFRVNTSTTYDQYDATVAMNDHGDFVIVWAEDDTVAGEIQARRFNSQGVPQGSVFRVNAAVANEFDPSVAMDDAGNFVVTWTRLAVQAEDDFGGVYARSFNSAGLAQGTDFHVNIQTMDIQRMPSVAMDADGDFAIVWHSRGADGYSIYARRYSAAGTALSAEIKVDPVTSRSDRLPQIAMAADGEFVVAWVAADPISGSDVLAQRYDAAGNAMGSEFRVNDYTNLNQTLYGIDMDAAGNFVAVWTNINLDGSGFGAYARRISGSNDRLGSEFRVNTWTTGDQANPTVALSASGNFVVNWISQGQDGDGDGIFAQRFQPVSNQPPTAPGFANLTTFEDAGNLTLNLQTGFNDFEDGSALLTYSVQSNSNASLVASTGVAGSQLTLAFAANAFGNTTLTIRATDSDGAFAEAPVTVSVLPLNDAPVLVNASLSMLEGQTIVLTPANLLVTDPDHSPSELTYTVTGNLTTGSLQKNSVPIPFNGTFTQQDVNDGLIRYVHNGNETFTDSFPFRVSDTMDAGVMAISRASLSTSGNQASGNSTLASLSADGKLLAFTSTANNLVPGDTNNRTDVFVRNLETGVTTRASVDSLGTEANGNSTEARLSPDGRYLVFTSAANNLVAGDTNGATDIFLRDLQTGTTTLLSNLPGGGFASGNSSSPAFSLDGRYVTLTSSASDLVPGDTNNVADVFVRDLQFGTMIRASVGPLGAQANGSSSSSTMSAGGRYVVFASNASNLISLDTNGMQDVFLRDLVTNTTSRISLNSSGNQATSGSSTTFYPSMTVDGRSATFDSLSPNIVLSDTNSSNDVFLRDLQAGVNSRLSLSSAGAQVSGTSRAPLISANGRYVVYVSSASGIVAGDSNGVDDVFIRDLQTNTNRRVSLTTGGNATGGASTLAAMSADGRYVAFESVATNITAGDTNAGSDIFVRDLGPIASVFSISITSQNDAPTLDPLATPVVLEENAPEQVLTLTGITAGPGESQTLTLKATSSDPLLVENPLITYTSPQSTAVLRYTPATGKSGVATITVTVTDSGLSSNGNINTFSRTFNVVVNDTYEDLAPTVTGVYAADAAGVAFAAQLSQHEQEVSAIATLVVTFSENMATSGPANLTSAEHWQLQRNGVDVTNQISGITFGLNPMAGRYEAQLSFASPLSDGTYELTVRSSLTDLVGNRLDGDSIASGFSENYTHLFSIAQPVAAGSEFRVNTFPTNAQQRPAVASSAAGYVAVWESVQDGPSSYGIYAQRYSPTGAPLGSEFRVNTQTGGHQRVPSVDMDDDGNFVVAWSSYLQDLSGDGIFALRFSAAGVPQGSEFQVNTYTTGDQRYANVALDADGDFVVAWTDYGGHDGGGRGIFAQRFNATGVAQGSEFQVNSYTTAAQHFAAMTMDPAGNFVIAWESHNHQDGAGYGIFAQRYSAAGMAQGSEFRINSYTTGGQQTVALASDREGNFVATWQSQQDGAGDGIYGQRFNAAGVALGSEFGINSSTTGNQRFPRVSMHADGDFDVTWVSAAQDGQGDGLFARRFNGAGVAQGSEFRVNTYTTGDQQFPSIAAGAAGDFLVSWVSRDQDGSSNGVYAQYFAATSRVTNLQIVGIASSIEPGERLVQVIPAGASLSASFSRAMSPAGGAAGVGSVTNPANYQLTRDGLDLSSQITSVSYLGTTATFTLGSTLASGNYVFTAKSTIQDTEGRALDGDASGVAGGNFVQAFSIGQPGATGSEFRVNTTTSQVQRTYDASPRSVASSATGEFVVVWANGQFAVPYGIYAQRYNAAGAPLGSEFRVTPATTVTQINPTVAMDASGDFVITWTSSDPNRDLGNGIFAQRYSAAGVPQGSVFHVNTYTTGAQQGSSIAMDASGDFVIAWNSDAQDGSQSGIYAQRFSAGGVRLGSEFRVNTYTTNSQSNPSVAINAQGDFVVSWSGVNQPPGGNSNDIYAQRFSRTGAAVGSEFRVNTFLTFSQDESTVALSNSGELVIAWTSTFQDGDWEGVYLQRYDASGATLGSNFLVNTFTEVRQSRPVVSMDAHGDFVVVWRSSNIFDANTSQDGNGYGVYGQRYNVLGVRQGSEFRINTYTTGNQTIPSVAMDDDGDFVVVWNSSGQDGSGYGIYAQRFGSPPPLQVSSITPTYSGVEVDFTRDFEASVLNLYDEGTTLGVTDVTLTGATVGSVRGSVVIDPGSRKLTFIKSGGPLAPDTYTLGLRSAAAGFVDPSGNLLDGNGDGLLGDSFTAQFTVAPPTGITLSVGDFARGFGQAVNLGGSGLPITISSALGVRTATFALAYDPALLAISGATLGAGLSGAVTLDTSLAGIARITITSSSQLSGTAGSKTLVTLATSVPTAAPYGSKEILDLTDIQLRDTLLAPIPALDDDGFHIAAYFGDANGSQTYNSPDATAAQRVIVGTNSGLLAYQLADPYLIVDISGNGSVQSNDVTLIQKAIVGTVTAEIPPIPVVTPAPSGGPDPLVSIPQNLVASVGGTITVPVELLVTERAGITLAGVDLAIAYDPTRLQVDAVQIGQLLVGFGFNTNSSTPGLIKLSSAGSSPLALPFAAGGILAELEFTVLGSTGPTRINLLENAESLFTALYDEGGRSLLLQPSPSNAEDDTVDGLLEILALDQVLAQNS